jgi:ATP synthase protein I
VDLIRQKREQNRGLGDALARSFEFAGTLAIFVGVGWLLDRWLGTTPWLMIVFAVLALVGLFAKLWYGYDAEMTRQEALFREARDR